MLDSNLTAPFFVTCSLLPFHEIAGTHDHPARVINIGNIDGIRIPKFHNYPGEITHRRTRPYRSQTNGKVERFNRTMHEEWAYVRPYGTEAEHVEALADFLHLYNHHRSHTALKGQPPMSRVNDLLGQYNSSAL